MNEKYELLLSKLRTKPDADQLLKEIDDLLSGIYEYGDGAVRSSLDSTVRYWVSEVISSSWGDTREGREVYLKNLREVIENLPMVKLTLAWEPNSDCLNKIHQKIGSIIGRVFVMDVEINRRIVGGVQVSYNGKYRDYSIKKLLDEMDDPDLFVSE